MITRVNMINWRAYDQREFQFEPGITFLMGANGSGKTSVLEAISYGLTGETALNNSKTRGKLLRNPEKNATVQVDFVVDGKNFQVERSQSNVRAADASLIRLIDRKTLASNHSQSTKRIEELVGVSADFLRRIIYMAEGDVFRFLDNPPQEALELQIRQVLGLNQLDVFIAALDRAEKNLKQQIASIRELSQELNRLEIYSKSDLDNHITAGAQVRSQILGQLKTNQQQSMQLTQESTFRQALCSQVSDVRGVVERSPLRWAGLSEKSVLAYFEDINLRDQNLKDRISRLDLSLAGVQGENRAYQRIIEILEPFDLDEGTLPCPVCRKPLTISERRTILDEIKGDIQRLEKQSEEIRREQEQLHLQISATQEQINTLRELRNRLAHGQLPEKINPNDSFQNLYLQVSDTIVASGRLSELDEERQGIENRLAELEKFQAEYLSIQNRLQVMSYDSPEEILDALVALEVRALSLRAASLAAQETLIAQRNIDMHNIYVQISRLWEAFSGEGGWQVELNSDGLPTFKNDLGRQFDMSQFSGGEKTAMLMMLHTIVAHNFSKSDFLMIDEPLEHLDPINRRSLVRFLVQSYRRGIFKQAIIATFEESLIRKYMSEEGVHIIHL